MPRLVAETLTIEKLAPTGEGIARSTHNDVQRTVFIPKSAPGDHLSTYVDYRSKPARAAAFTLLEGSPDRISPACPHVDQCGGCTWMHLSASAQQAHRLQLLQELFSSFPELAIEHHPSTSHTEYRTRARWSIQAGDPVRIGYRAFHSNKLVTIDSCLVVAKPLQSLLHHLPNIVRGSKGKGEAQVALGKEQLPVVALQWQGQLAPQAFAESERLVQAHEIAGISIREGQISQAATIGEPAEQFPAWDGGVLHIPPEGFSQANPSVTNLMVEQVRLLASPEDRRVLELYSGAGTFSIALAKGAQVFGSWESNQQAVVYAKRNLQERGLVHRYVKHGTVETSELSGTWDVVVLDPPRAGAKSILANIRKTKAKRVIYISCNPATLVRDAETLVSLGFSATHLHGYDMFPQTHHVECVMVFDRN
jgi:23S rRNA (uracil1939-C5)-methyltransferase